MPREFELPTEITVDATPEEVWDAIATGPGIDSWFMGRSELHPGEDGVVRVALGAYTMESKITVWDPPRRFAHRTDVEPDGTFRAFEYMIEGRDQGSTVVRAVLSGFLGADDWETEYNALSQDGPIYPHTLGQYLTYFPGRTAQPITEYGSRVVDRETYWSRLRSLGLPAGAKVRDEVRLAPDGLPPIDGIVDYLSPTQLGIRSPDGLFRLVHGMSGTVFIGHHLFDLSIDDQPAAQQAWTSWLDRTFA